MKERDEKGSCRCCGASEEEVCYQPDLEEDPTISQSVQLMQALQFEKAVEENRRVSETSDLVIDFNRALMIVSNYLSQQHIPQQSVAVALDIIKDFIRLNVPKDEQNFAIAHQDSKTGAMMDQYLQITRQLSAKFAAWRVEYMRTVHYELTKDEIDYQDAFMAVFGANLHRIFYAQIKDEKIRLVNVMSFTQFFENRKDEATGELFLFNNVSHAENVDDVWLDNSEQYALFLKSYQIVAT